MSTKTTPARVLQALQEAIALHNSGRLDEADAIYRKVLQQAPKNPDALHLRALVCHARENWDEMARLAEAAIAFAPRVANFHNTAGEAWRRQGQLGKARRRLAEAIRLDPAMAMAHHNLSMVCSAEGRHQDALESNRQALQRNSAYPEALIHGLTIAYALEDEVLASSLAARVENVINHGGAKDALAVYHCNRARTQFKRYQFAEGDEAAAKAIATDPEFWGGWGLRGEAALEQLAFAKAEMFCTIAVNLAPENEDARRNLALNLKNQKRLDEATSHLQPWLKEHPDDAEARFMLGTIDLMGENYTRGWTNYEARWGVAPHRQAKFSGATQWSGQAVNSLLLYAEQGLGDTVQMLRFLPEVCRRCGGRVVLLVPAPLLRITRRVFGSDQVSVVAEVPVTPFDAACPLMSLPLALGVNSPEDIRNASPYLWAASERVADFSRLLAGQPGRKLGFVWRGSEGSGANRLRKLPEAALAPLLELPGWTPVSLQFGISAPEISSRPLVDLSTHITDFEDLAAAMMAVDAVVSLDTGPVHLAGALGIPTYTLLPWLHDWRWGIEGDRCSWYPTMELFRQRVGGSWHGAIGRLAEKLGGTLIQSEAEDVQQHGPILSNHFPLVRAACRDGIFTLPVFDRLITRSLLVYGDYSRREAEVLASCLERGDIAVDVGANLGALTLAMARAVGSVGRIIAIEPGALPHQCLTETIADSAVPWVEARRQAAGAKAGITRMSNGETVDSVCLDDLALADCRLIRINARGCELEVLKGAAGLIAEHHPAVFCVASDRQQSQEPLVAFLKGFGYRLFTLESPLFSAQNYRSCTANLFPGRDSVNLVGLPSTMSPLADMRPLAV